MKRKDVKKMSKETILVTARSFTTEYLKGEGWTNPAIKTLHEMYDEIAEQFKQEDKTKKAPTTKIREHFMLKDQTKVGDKVSSAFMRIWLENPRYRVLHMGDHYYIFDHKIYDFIREGKKFYQSKLSSPVHDRCTLLQKQWEKMLSTLIVDLG